MTTDMKTDIEKYIFKIRKELVDGDTYFVGRVEEFPDVAVYEDTYLKAHQSLVEVLELMAELYEEQEWHKAGTKEEIYGDE